MRRCALKSWLRAFCDDARGTVTVEAVICLPLLFWAIAASYEFFEVYRYKSVRDKAAYTVTDMLSRETEPITASYLDSAKTLFDMITRDSGANQLRISIIGYDSDREEYSVTGSEVRGSGEMSRLTTEYVETAEAEFPSLTPGNELIVVEFESTYHPILNIGFNNNISIGTRVFASPRFAPQIIWNVDE